MTNQTTDSNIYEPTTAEKKLLEVLLDPASTKLNITDICERAGVARKTYYKATAKDGFNDLVKDTALDLIKGKVAPLINATYKYALKERGHQDRKLLLEILKIHKDKVEIDGELGLNLKVEWSDEED